MEIPEKIKSFNFVLCDQEKRPIEKGWQKKIRRYDDPVLLSHLNKGLNYGVSLHESSVLIGNQTYFLIVVDFDSREFQDKVIHQFPETLTTTSGSPKGCYHIWLACDNNKAFKIRGERMETLADVLGEGNQVIACGSKHKCGSTYSIVKDLPIAFMPYSEIEAILKPYDKTPKKATKPRTQYTPRGVDKDISSEIINAVSMESVLSEIGIDTSKNPTNCFAHASNGGKCFSFNDETAHCFHCDGSWNKFSLVREAKNFTDKETFEWFADKSGMTDKLKKARKEFVKESSENGSYQIFSRRGQIESFWKQHPFFYDKSKMFWLWNPEQYKWEMSDEIEFLNSIQKSLGVETIDTTARNELTEGFKQIGRDHKPKDTPMHWVQFKDRIYDLKTDKSFNASPEYFVKNPIPWKVGITEETPTIDRLFHEWVGKDSFFTLQQIFAYSICPDRFMQRVFAFVGGGSNGKGTCIKLLYKFLGEENCVSSELKLVSENQFESAILYGKLVVIFGEVAYDDLKNTNTLKQIAGEDKLRFCFKSKTPFTDHNTAMGICLTNSLPVTPDKTLGFYRKWLIIDFPNQFKPVKENPIQSIPNVEFENFSLKCLRILKELYNNPSFVNEGDFDERVKRYEERSNPVMKFVESCCDETAGEHLPLREFTNRCNAFLKSRHLRIMTAIQIGKILRNEGFLVGNVKVGDTSIASIKNLRILEISEISKSVLDSYKETSRKFDIFDISDIPTPIKNDEDQVQDLLGEVEQ